MVRTYTLKYEAETTGSKRNRIRSIEECGDAAVADNCYSTPITFGWRDSGLSESFSESSGPLINVSDGDVFEDWHWFTDMNGDGIPDLIKSGIFTQLDQFGRIVKLKASSIYVQLGKVDGTYESSVSAVNSLTVPTVVEKGLKQWNELVDVNGDGILDIFRIDSPFDLDAYAETETETERYIDIENKNKLYVHIGQNDGSFSSGQVIAGGFTYNEKSFRYANQLIDMNADGLLDLFSVDPNNHQTFQVYYGALNQAGEFSFSSAVSPAGVHLANYTLDGEGGFRSTNLLVDANGDGLVDVLHLKNGVLETPKTYGYPGIQMTLASGYEDGGISYTSSETVHDVITNFSFLSDEYSGYLSLLNQFLDVNNDGNVDSVSVSVARGSYVTEETEYYYGGFVDARVEEGDWHKCKPVNINETLSHYEFVLNEYSFPDIKISNELNVKLGKGDGTFEEETRVSNDAITNEGVLLKAKVKLGDEEYSWGSSINLEENFVGRRIVNESFIYGCTRGVPDVNNYHYVWSSNIKFEVVKRSHTNCKYTDYSIESGRGLTQRNQFVDIDADGTLDVISLESGGEVFAAYGDGAGGFSDRVSLGVTMKNTESDDIHKWNKVLDVNGDGMVDIFSADATSTTIHLSNRKAASLIESVSNGQGLVNTVSYRPITDASVYTKTSDAETYPNVKVQAALNVVDTLTVSAGSDEYVTNFHYQNARANRLRGWLGFEQITKTDYRGLINVSSFHQDYPFTGRISQTDIRSITSPAENLESTEYDWSTRVDTDGTQFPHLSGTRHSRYEPNENYSLINTVTTRYQDNTSATDNHDDTAYDEFGNPEKIVISNSQDEHQTTSTFDNVYATNANYPGQLTSQGTTVAHVVSTGVNASKTVDRTFDTSGRLSTESSTLGQGDAIKNIYTYDGYGHVNKVTSNGWDGSVTDAGAKSSGSEIDRVVDYDYSSLNLRAWVKTETANGLSNTYTYDAYWGALDSYEDVTGATTSWEQDAMGRQTKEMVFGLSSSTEYSTVCTSTSACLAETKLVVKTTPAGVDPIETQYDALGRAIRTVTQATDASLIYQDTTYNNRGNIWKSYMPRSASSTEYFTESSYDDYNRIKTIKEPSGTTYTHTYGVGSKAVTRTSSDEQSQQTGYRYDSQGQIRTITQGSIQTEYSYGPFGVLTQIKDTGDNLYSWSGHDLYGNPSSQTDPSLGAWKYRYNAFGELVWLKDAKSQITSYGYDDLGRQTSRIEKSTPSITTSWLYDAEGQAGLLSSVKRNGQTLSSYGYDDSYKRLNRQTTTIEGLDYSVSNTYSNTTGVVETVTYPGSGPSIKYNYYSNGLLKTLADAADSSTEYWRADSYNVYDQVRTEKWGNGITGTRGYDNATGRMININSGPNGAIQNLSYQYYESGNLKKRINHLSFNDELFNYDTLDRLVGIQSSSGRNISYRYDDLGNITYKSYLGDFSYEKINGAGPHAVTRVRHENRYSSSDINSTKYHVLGSSSSGIDCDENETINIADVICLIKYVGDAAESYVHYQYKYDGNGNMMDGAGRAYTYTQANMPKTIFQGGRTTTLGYDENHQRVTKEINFGGAISKHTYVGDLYEKIEENGTTEHRYYLSADNRLVAQINKTAANSETYYAHTDLMGSVERMSNEQGVAGAESSRSFDEFGEARSNSWQTNAPEGRLTTRGYTGHESDYENGLINMNARMYDPEVGRFTTPDSIIPDVYNPQSLNRYSYVLNNPFRYVDPTGHAYADIIILKSPIGDP